MKKKNGFVFIETMIVVVTVLVSLLLIYSSYVGLRSLERKRVRYDDPAFIYRTYAVGKFLTSITDEHSNSVLKSIIYELKYGSERNMKYIRYDDNEWYTNPEYTIGACSGNCKEKLFKDLYDKLHVFNIIIMDSKNMKNLLDPNSKECTDNTSEHCSNIPNNFYNYIKSIDTTSDDDYYLIVEYAEKINGRECNPNELISAESSVKVESGCTYYFSNLKLGGDFYE